MIAGVGVFMYFVILLLCGLSVFGLYVKCLCTFNVCVCRLLWFAVAC